MRMFRIARIFKLVKDWPQMKFFIRTLSTVMKKIGSFALILSVFMFMYAIMGV